MVGLWREISCSSCTSFQQFYFNTWHVEVGLLLDGFLLWISLPEIGISGVRLLLLLFWLLSSWLMGQLVDTMGLKMLQQTLTATKGPAHTQHKLYFFFRNPGRTFHTRSMGKDVHRCGLACDVSDALSEQIAWHNLSTACIISLSIKLVSQSYLGNHRASLQCDPWCASADVPSL